MTNGGSPPVQHGSAWDRAFRVALVALSRLGDWLWVDAPRRRRAKVVVAGLFFAWLGYMHLPPPYDDPTKDPCELGEVTRERYLEFLAYAQAKVRSGEWGRLPNLFAPPVDGPLSPRNRDYERLRGRFDEMVRLATTNNEVSAAVHAAARAMGGRLEIRENDYWFAKNPEYNSPSIRRYRFHQSYFGLNRVYGWPEITLSLAPPFGDSSPFIGIRSFGTLEMINGMDKFDKLSPIFVMREPPFGICPPVLPFVQITRR